MASDGTHRPAIRAKRVLGAKVTDPAGNKIGEIEDLVLDKHSDRILFAVIGFGGFLGIAEKYHPIPWSILNFDLFQNSYVVDFTREQLHAAPAFSIDELTRLDESNLRDQIYGYYKPLSPDRNAP